MYDTVCVCVWSACGRCRNDGGGVVCVYVCVVFACVPDRSVVGTFLFLTDVRIVE